MSNSQHDDCQSRAGGCRARAQGNWLRVLALLLSVSALALTIAADAAEDDQSKPAVAPASAKLEEGGKTSKKPPAKKPNREPSVTGVMSLLGLGEGAAIADIGAGNGEDTWVFAKLVGSTGTVFAEEIGDGKVKSLGKEAEKRGLSQVRAVLGLADDPCLPPGAIDLACMRHAYHHFTKPREMLRGIWRALKPGGHLVVIDKNLGTLRDWVPRDARGEKHYWIAETTVVREAEQGDPHLGPEPIDAVFFLDSFHLLFHGKTLLAKLHERLAPDGRVWVLDREAKEPLVRREASHRRRIEPAVVKQEMAAAGFVLQGELPRPAADRFLLVFGKNKP